MTAGKASRVQDCIEHRLGAIGRIESYVQGLDPASFSGSPLVQDAAVIRNFEIIGEAANKIQAVDISFADVIRSSGSTSPTGCATH